jgi:hypothetical protein
VYAIIYPSGFGIATLFSFAAGIAFGIWYGVKALFGANLGRQTEGKFALAATVSAIACACVHEVFFTYVPKLEAHFGGRVIHKWAEDTPPMNKKFISIMRDMFGGVVFLGVPEAAIGALPETRNCITNILRVTCSYVLGFFPWYLYE